MCFLQEGTRSSFVSLEDFASHRIGSQQEKLYPPETFSNQMEKFSTNGLQWKVGLGQWSQVSRWTLGGARRHKKNCITNSTPFEFCAFWVQAAETPQYCGCCGSLTPLMQPQPAFSPFCSGTSLSFGSPALTPVLPPFIRDRHPVASPPASLPELPLFNPAVPVQPVAAILTATLSRVLDFLSKCPLKVCVGAWFCRRSFPELSFQSYAASLAGSLFTLHHMDTDDTP